MVWYNENDDLDGIELPLNLHIEEKTDNFTNICQCGLYSTYTQSTHTVMSSSKYDMNNIHLCNCELEIIQTSYTNDHRHDIT